MKHHHAKESLKLAILAFIQDETEPTGIATPDGTQIIRYHESWNDENIAARFGATISNVRGLRERNVGLLKMPSKYMWRAPHAAPAPPPPPLEERLRALEQLALSNQKTLHALLKRLGEPV